VRDISQALGSEASLLEGVKRTLGVRLSVTARQRTKAPVYFDAWKDALHAQQLSEFGTVLCGLDQSLLEADHSAEILANIRGCEQNLAKRSSRLLRIV